MKRAHIIVTGIVQGVSFRLFAKKTADNLGITGWVRNIPNGSVEIVAEGNEESLEKFILELKKGPPAARVESVKTDYSDATYEFSRFEIKKYFFSEK